MQLFRLFLVALRVIDEIPRSRDAPVFTIFCWVRTSCSAKPILRLEVSMRFERVSFGSIRIDGTTYEHDVVIDRGRVRRRKKKPSKQFRGEFGHTPLSIEEKIPWKCRRLVVGTGTGALPVMEEVKREARHRKIKLMILPTKEAIKELKQKPDGTNAVLHVTC